MIEMSKYKAMKEMVLFHYPWYLKCSS